jgi:hypothetical protein
LPNTNPLQQGLSNSVGIGYVDNYETSFCGNGGFSQTTTPAFGFGSQEADLWDFTSPTYGQQLNQLGATQEHSSFSNALPLPTNESSLPLYPGMAGLPPFEDVPPTNSFPGVNQDHTNEGVLSFDDQSMDGFMAKSLLPPHLDNQGGNGYPLANEAGAQIPMHALGDTEQRFQSGMQPLQSIPNYPNGLGLSGMYPQPFPNVPLPMNPLTQTGFGSNQVQFQRRPCPSCFESFTRTSDLERHYQSIHLGIKYDCFWPGCHNNRGKGYCRLEKLKTHQREKHGSA